MVIAIVSRGVEITYASTRMSLSSDFFFQAEDGIRDLYVTGVQTCALPISRARRAFPPETARRCRPRPRGRGARTSQRSCEKYPCHSRPSRSEAAARGRGEMQRAKPGKRSEERRVGKECRSRRAAKQ